jgi:uncharacterized membrane protein YeaQ/YmgE (transglycosylase-associated protein family)
MDIVMWMLAGSVIGWAGFVHLGFNEERGMSASVIIGAIGGVVGGKLLAPMLGAAAAAPGEFSLAVLIVALASAAACLAAANKIHERFGV